VSSTNSEPWFRTFRRLWQRAPLWRLIGMSAGALTLLFILFSRYPHHQSASTGSASNASYISQAPASAPTDINARHVATTSITSTPSHAVLANTPVPVYLAKGTKQPGTSKLVASVPKVHTASLSLATPSSSSAGSSGLDNGVAGRSYNGSLRVDGFNVPLPGGNWLMLANTSVKLPSSAGEMIYLGQIKKKRLVGAIRITAVRSLARPGAGFRAAPGCIDHQEDNNFVMSEEVIPNGHQACWIIGIEVTSPLQQWADRAVKLDSLDRAAAGDMAAKGVSYPQDLVLVRFTRAETWGVLEVKYFFSPETAGIKSNDAFSPRDSDWFAQNISRFPEKQAYIDKLKQWATQFWPRFKNAFDSGQPGN
jgi:hypothetical protein